MRTSALRAILGVSLIAGGYLASPLHAQTYTIAQKIANPSYFVPGSLWTQLDESTPYVGIAVANVVNGPDYQAYSDYANAIQQASAAGIKVLGYVRTGYFSASGFTTRLGQTDPASWIAQIEQDVNAWYSFYGSSGLAGIFFDEGMNACGANNLYPNLYSAITAYVKQNHKGALVVENPGAPVPSCFQGTADIILTYEGSYLCYIQDASCPAALQYTPLDWNPVDPFSIWHILYGLTSAQYANAATLTKARGAGWVYFTSDTLPNPYDTLPSGADWSAEMSGTAPGGGDTTPPSTPSGLSVATSGLGYTSVVLNWNSSTDSGSGVVAYDIFQSGVWILSNPAATSSTQALTLTGLLPNTAYSFTVRARDGSGNISADSNTCNLTTQAANGALPTAPGNLSGSSVAYTAVTLSWTSSSDSLGISAYDVYKNGAKIVTLDGSTSSVVIGGLSPSTQYTFTVRARDLQGNISSLSNAVDVVTLALPSDGAISSPGGTYGSTLTYSANFNLPFGFQHVFIDSDNNASTGWITSSNPVIGADYVVENGTLYKYAGSGNDWTWTRVGNITPSVNGYTVTWTVPLADLTNAATTQKVVFEGNGFAPTAYSRVITLMQGITISAVVTISGSMEGNLPVKPGDTVKAGFDFTGPGAHPADAVSFTNVSVTLPVQCPNGTTDTLTIPISNYTVTVPAGNSDWFPSGDQNSPLVYQGSIVVPSNLCGGQQGHAPRGATFNASLAASTNDSVHVRFHYGDNTAGGWSGTNAYFH
jgi:chitodextrinase